MRAPPAWQTKAFVEVAVPVQIHAGQPAMVPVTAMRWRARCRKVTVLVVVIPRRASFNLGGGDEIPAGRICQFGEITADPE